MFVRSCLRYECGSRMAAGTESSNASSAAESEPGESTFDHDSVASPPSDALLRTLSPGRVSEGAQSRSNLTELLAWSQAKKQHEVKTRTTPLLSEKDALGR